MAAAMRVLWRATIPAGGALSADGTAGVKADVPIPGVAGSPDVNRGPGTNSGANAMVLGMGGTKPNGPDAGVDALGEHEVTSPRPILKGEQGAGGEEGGGGQ